MQRPQKTAKRGRRLMPVASGVIAILGPAMQSTRAQDGFDLTLPPSSIPDRPAVAATADTQVDADAISAYFAAWSDRVAHVRATQPHWSSPIATTTGLLEQRVRFDVDQEHSGNGTDTTLLDGGKGLDLIVSDSNEIQIAAPPYYFRSGAPAATPKGKPIASLAGYGDWTFVRLEQRLASSPDSDGDYVLTAWLQILAPSGIERLSNESWQYLPTLAFGKGFGDFDVQATVGGVLPASHVNVIGHQIQTNVAFQYHIRPVFWPELEVNWTYYADGARGGLNRVYLTPGIVVGRFALNDALQFTFGVGYQVAVAPPYRASPLTPSYDHAWLVTTRLNF